MHGPPAVNLGLSRSDHTLPIVVAGSRCHHDQAPRTLVQLENVAASLKVSSIGIEAMDEMIASSSERDGFDRRSGGRIVAVSREASVCQGLAFSYGVHPVQITQEPDNWSDFARRWLREYQVPGVLAMLAAGPSTLNPDANHRLEFLRVEESARQRLD